jgi:hypothetical protein
MTTASIIITSVVIVGIVFSGKYFSMVEKSLDTAIKQSEKDKNKDKGNSKNKTNCDETKL